MDGSSQISRDQSSPDPASTLLDTTQKAVDCLYSSRPRSVNSEHITAVTGERSSPSVTTTTIHTTATTLVNSPAEMSRAIGDCSTESPQRACLSAVETSGIGNSPGETSVFSELLSDSVLSNSFDTSFKGPHVQRVKVNVKRLREITIPTGEEEPIVSPITADETRLRDTNPTGVRESRRAGLPQGKLMAVSGVVVSADLVAADVGTDPTSWRPIEPTVTSYDWTRSQMSDVDEFPVKLSRDGTTKASKIPDRNMNNVEARSAPVHNIGAELTTQAPALMTSSSADVTETDIIWRRRMEKYPGIGHLIQGRCVTVPGWVSDLQDSGHSDLLAASNDDTAQIHVSHFDLDAKQRGVERVLNRRQDLSRPIRRVVQPHVITNDNSGVGADTERHHRTWTPADCQPESETRNQDALTAAVAASAAIAITQPYIKAQHELDTKMADVLNKLQAAQGIKRESLTREDRERVQKLEQQLADLTQKRIDFIERIQLQHMNCHTDWQTPLMAPSTGPSRQYASLSHLDKFGKYKEERPTPAPVSYKTDKAHQGRGKFLEDILTYQSPDRHDVIKSPPTLSSLIGRGGSSPESRIQTAKRETATISADLTDRLTRVHHGPSPLDSFLLYPTVHLPSSPYPSMADTQVISTDRYNISTVEQVMDTLTKNKNCLESNFQQILKAKNDANVYNIIDSMTNISTGADVARRKRMVDNCIEHLNEQVKALVEEDFSRQHRAKLEAEIRPMIMEEKPVKRPLREGRARVDSGRKKVAQAKIEAQDRGKENVLISTKAAVTKSAVRTDEVYYDERHLTHVYGKAAYQNRRTTVKYPYMHYKNPVSPTLKRNRPQLVQDVKAVSLTSVRTQTSGHKRALIKGPPGLAVAISLGPPRQGGYAPPALVTRLDTKHEIKQTPIAKPRTPRKQLDKKVIAGVDIEDGVGQDTDLTEHNQTRRQDDRLHNFVHASHDRRQQQEETPDVGDGMTIPGYRPPTPDHYLGPTYPLVDPRLVTSSGQQELPAERLAEMLRQRDLLHNRAHDWIEQQLMARMLLKQETDRARTPADPLPYTVGSGPSTPPDHPGSARVLGPRGVQLFVDAGLPVNELLVKKLIRDVIRDRLRRSMAANETHQRRRVQITSVVAIQKSESGSDEEHGNLADTSVQSSPPKIMSPLDAHSTARSSMQSDSESTNELAAIWGRKPVLTIDEEDSQVVHTSKRQVGMDTPVTCGSEVWDDPDFPRTPMSQHGQSMSQAPSTPSTPAETIQPPDELETPKPSVVVDPGSPHLSSAVDDSESESEVESPPKPIMDEIAVQTDPDVVPAPSSPVSSVSPASSTAVTDTLYDSMSEGEWLISHSEGQAPPLDLGRRIALLQYLQDDDTSVNVSMDRIQEELYQGYVRRSVGEFVRVRKPQTTALDQYSIPVQYPSTQPPYPSQYQAFTSPVLPPNRQRHLDTQRSVGELVFTDTGGEHFDGADRHYMEQRPSDTADDSLRLSDLRGLAGGLYPPSHQSTPAPPDSSSTRPTPAAGSSDTRGHRDDVMPRPHLIHVRGADDVVGVDDTMRNVQATLASTRGHEDELERGREVIDNPDQDAAPVSDRWLTSRSLGQVTSMMSSLGATGQTVSSLDGTGLDGTGLDGTGLGGTGQFSITESGHDSHQEQEGDLEGDYSQQFDDDSRDTGKVSPRDKRFLEGDESGHMGEENPRDDRHLVVRIPQLPRSTMSDSETVDDVSEISLS